LASHVLGELLITLGMVLLLLVIYQLWWTNVQAAAATSAERDTIVHQWQQPLTPGQGGAATTPISSGVGFGLLYIPRLRDKVWALPILQGVGLDLLAQGAGHYPGTALPGELGNFAIAAHRATHNEPFRDIDQLAVGDRVYVQTRGHWFSYVLDKDQIVLPTATWVIEPVPGHPDQAPTQPLITLTTCNPRWASYQRWIWWGHLVASGTTVPDGLTGTS
jgi:sortase A